MATIWILSNERSLPETLAHHLRALGSVHTGRPERAGWIDTESPDLITVIGADTPDDFRDLEACLDFLHSIPAASPRAAAAPVIYVQPPSGRPTSPLLHELIDDRPLRVLGWPLEPDDLVDVAAALLELPGRPTSLRERARRAWVTRRTEVLYAQIDLVELRHAVDPRNAQRPVLLVGEPGSGRGILAHYIHQLAEPVRDELIVVPASSLRAGSDQRLLEQTRGRRVTVYLEGIDRVEREVQERLLQLLGSSGALGLEPMRWIASASRARALIAPMRQLPWIRVPLPPLRERGDLAALARGLAALWSEGVGRVVELDPSALAALADYAWPGNLRELEAVIDAALARAAGPLASAEDVSIGLSRAPNSAPDPAVRIEPAPAPGPTPEPAPAATESPAVTGALSSEPALAHVIPPLAQEIREPMLAIRTYANLLEQRPDDASVRREFSKLVERDLGQLEETINRLERFAGLKEDGARPFGLAALIEGELERRADKLRAGSVVLQRELDHEAPPARADEERVRFAIGMLFDRALRMLPSSGELYIGSHHQAESAEHSGHHRVLIRFQSPEEVLIAPEGGPGPSQPLEVVLARALIEGVGGSFAVDVSGVQDNLVLISLPG